MGNIGFPELPIVFPDTPKQLLGFEISVILKLRNSHLEPRAIPFENHLVKEWPRTAGYLACTYCGGHFPVCEGEPCVGTRNQFNLKGKGESLPC